MSGGEGEGGGKKRDGERDRARERVCVWVCSSYVWTRLMIFTTAYNPGSPNTYRERV